MGHEPSGMGAASARMEAPEVTAAVVVNTSAANEMALTMVGSKVLLSCKGRSRSVGCLLRRAWIE